MVGFFKYVRILNNCNNEVLKAGQEYDEKFKSNSITTDVYRAEMLGKIITIAETAAEGNEELSKKLEDNWVNPLSEYLKETVNDFKEQQLEQ